MKVKVFSIILAIFMLFNSASTVLAVQGTDGDELQVIEPQKLEIQLGTEWAGVEFMLKTDAGVYPDVIPVDSSGVLSLEIGGSKTYLLSCLQSSVAIPEFIDGQAPVTSDPEQYDKNDDTEDNKVDIPIAHIIVFALGILVAIAILSYIFISNKKRQIVQNDEEDDDF